MLRELQKRMEELHMVSAKETVLVGVSGGADSVCLLLVLQKLQKEMDFAVEAVHVEHGIRGEESLKDAEFVENLCKSSGVVCHKVSVDVLSFCKQTGLGTEEAARILRYEVFTKLALEKNAKVALAHHQEDNAETILFQLIRGSSLTGLCGMQPVRKDENGVCYIRPLLHWHREEIEQFLKQNGVEWRIDSTNAQLEYSRNFLRHEVVPKLVQMNPQAVEHINQTASHLTEMKSYLDAQTQTVWQQIVNDGQRVSWKVDDFRQLHPVMQRQIVYKAITHLAGQKKDITSAHVEEVRSLCEVQSGKRVSLPYGITAGRAFHEVYVTKETPEESLEDKVYEVSESMLMDLLEKSLNEPYSLAIGKQGEKLIFQCKDTKGYEIPRKTYTKCFDYDKIKQGFCIRTRRSGDYFISDASGHHKKLKEYFIDEKIPVSDRDKKWLLADGSKILWIIGGRISEHIKITQKTKRILEITYDGGRKNE